MVDSNLLDEIAKKINAVLPSGVKDVKNDVEKNTKVVLQSAFAKLDLVTRDEFDAQAKVLARTRSKLTALEKQLGELEEQLQKNKA